MSIGMATPALAADLAQGESVCRVWSAEGSQERSEAKHEHFEERALASDEKWSPFIRCWIYSCREQDRRMPGLRIDGLLMQQEHAEVLPVVSQSAKNASSIQSWLEIFAHPDQTHLDVCVENALCA